MAQACRDSQNDANDYDVIEVSEVEACRNGDLLRKLRRASNTSLLVIRDILYRIHRHPTIVKEVIDAGFVGSYVPVDGGLALFAKRGFSEEFLRKTVEVWRKSVSEGPYPIHYNTARFLYALTKFVCSRARGHVIEVGTGNGFSTLWLAHAAKEVGVNVISIDSNASRVAYAKKVLSELGLDNAQVIHGDAKNYGFNEVSEATVVFIDGAKNEYLEYLKNVERVLASRALILAHNTLSDSYVMKSFLEYLCSRGECLNVATDPSGILLATFTR